MWTFENNKNRLCVELKNNKMEKNEEQLSYK